MPKNRLFTFGCSFTNYQWPTWADILGRDYRFYENWGKVGSGNQCIFNSLVEAHQRHQFSKNDTIAIMWSGVTREDRYINGNWITPGNIYSNNTYDSAYINKYVDERGFLIRDLATIRATIDLLSYWNVQWYMFSMLPLDSYNDNFNIKVLPNKNTDVLRLYADVFPHVKPSVFEVVFNFDWDTRFKPVPLSKYNAMKGASWPTYDDYCNSNYSSYPKNIQDEIDQLNQLRDLHPTPLEHLEYITTVAPEIHISEETRNWIATGAYNTQFNPITVTDRL